MKLEYKEGLLFSSIKIKHAGKIIEVKDIVIDTGASYCIIEPSVIEDLGIILTKDDEIETLLNDIDFAGCSVHRGVNPHGYVD